jgi:hypothetical protein
MYSSSHISPRLGGIEVLATALLLLLLLAGLL